MTESRIATELRWHSQPFPPEGASAAEGILSQLGRPEMDLLTVLVREAVQNSWDARLDGEPGGVEFRLDLHTVSPAHAAAWRTLLLDGSPQNGAHFPLRRSLSSGSIRVLVVSDRGTKGLGGPTRADEMTTGPRDFVTFVRNIGEPRDTDLGGGTYGFGKGIFFMLSASNSILIHTRAAAPDGTLETRLIGSSLSKSYVDPMTAKRFTGRHWWGKVSGALVEPLVDDEADAMAARLGLAPFAESETGTSIVVIDPDLSDFEGGAQEASAHMADAILWHLWPKMIRDESGRSPIRFSVRCDQVEVAVPDPETTLPVKMFVRAYKELQTTKKRELYCKSPRKYLGNLGLVKQLMPPTEISRAGQDAGIEHLVHHVCLMRPAELVVSYYAGPKPPGVNVGYAGIFRADESMDVIYAQSEPPTHDAWNWQSLTGPDRTFVRTTFRRIDEELDGFLGLTTVVRTGVSGVALGAASGFFSKLLRGSWGQGGRTAAVNGAEKVGVGLRPTPGSGAGTGADPGLSAAGRSQIRPRVQYEGHPYLARSEGSAVVVQEFTLPVEVRQRLYVDLDVATKVGATGREGSRRPIGGGAPQLLKWIDPTGNETFDSQPLVDGGAGRWRAVIVPAPDTVTDIAIRSERGDAQ
jgi:hypothetical protein